MLEAPVDLAGHARLVPAPPLARFAFRGGDEATAAAGAAYGLAFPEAISRGTSIGERGQPGARVALKLGPDEFWLLVPEAEGEAVRAAMAAALARVPHALVDISHRQLGFVLEGEAAADLLAAGCPLDLDTRAFPEGMTTRTLYHKAEVMLWRTAPTAFRIEIARSLAPYFLALLDEAAKDL